MSCCPALLDTVKGRTVKLLLRFRFQPGLLVPRDKPPPPAVIQIVSRPLFVADDVPSPPCVDGSIDRMNDRYLEGSASHTANSELSLLADTAMAGASAQFPMPLVVRGPSENTSDDTPSPPFITGCVESPNSQNLEVLTPNTANRGSCHC